MTNLECKDIIGALRSDFGALWQCRQLANSLEITTPYLYPNNDFVSVYLTIRGGRIIISDGARLSEFVETSIDDMAFSETATNRFSENWGIKKFLQGKH